MPDLTPPQRLLVIDVDGLRQDVFHLALKDGRIPRLQALLSAPKGASQEADGCHLDPVSPAPSITFCAQTTIFTGTHPEKHGIMGNQFFDRFGQRSAGKPRFYAFDVGDALAYDDAVLTFSSLPGLACGLVGQALSPDVLTLYELAARCGKTSAVVYHMVSRGAKEWIRPNLVKIARLTKGGGLLGLSAEEYDQEMLQKTLAYLRTGARPDVLTVYFMGLDHTSHQYGPGAQLDYLARVIDPLIGNLEEALRGAEMLDNTLVLLVSDHGQIGVIPDDRHSLRLSFPFDREMGYLFDALGLDVCDKPREGPNCEAVVASNGGLAHVYLRRRSAEWSAIPRFAEDVLPVARAFWEAHATGAYAPDMQGALSAVLVRNAQYGGWEADYQALTPPGEMIPVGEFFDQHPELKTVDAPARLHHLAGPLSGDLLLISNYSDGFYFGGPASGTHGGLHADDSQAVASIGWIGASTEQWAELCQKAGQIVTERQEKDGRTRASLADALPLLSVLMHWED